MGSSSSTLRRRRRVVLRWDPRGPPPPRAGPPLRLAPAAGAPLVGAPGRADEKPPPPGRDGPPVRGAPVLGRALMGRGPPGGPPRLAPVGMGRRAPGGGGIGRPVELRGRPGGGGIGRPEALSGGRLDPSPSPAPPRCVGRMVVGPSGETLRVGAGFGGVTRDRTTRGASAAGVTGAAGATGAAVSGAALSAGALGGALTRVTRGASAGAAGVSGSGAALPVALVAFVALPALAGSAGTSRRRPSASARRRMRSAWASSMDADGLEAPIPNFWASASNSLLVRPSSLESSCTRIFFGAKTFPYIACPRVRRAQFPILSQLRPFTGRETLQRRHIAFVRHASQRASHVGNSYFSFALTYCAPPHSPTTPHRSSNPA